jgi:methionyl-tRNA formyltransferase
VSTERRPLRVFIITEDDPLYVIRFFDVFLAEYPRDRIDLAGITVSRAFHEPLWKTARRIWRFYGTVDFVRLLVRWSAAKVSGRRIGTLARTAGINVIEAASVNSAQFLHRLRELDVDVVVSVAAPEVFKQSLLSTPRMGAINIHSGRLPQYRGMMPTFWQMRAGERCATVTIHEMAEKLDAGGILATLDFPLKDRDALDRVISGTKEAGARLMIQTLLRFDPSSGERPSATPFDVSNGRYHRFPDPHSVSEFRQRGHRML